jgi:hypothetical protein
MTNEPSNAEQALPPEQAAAQAAILAECDRLAEGGITFVAVHFDASGDEGVSDDIKCCITEDYAYEESEAQQANVSHLQQHFEALVPYGYENDCGGFGDVILNVKTRKIAIERNDRFEDYTTSSLELRGLTIAHPMKHAESSAGRFGGRAEDYLPIHNWFDESKAFMADFRHRALRHHAEGIFLCERIFGAAITNSEGKKVPVRYIGEQHVREDVGRIPTAQDWLSQIKPVRWMCGQRFEQHDPHSIPERIPVVPSRAGEPAQARAILLAEAVGGLL